MKIYLAYSGVGGWSIESLSELKPEILISYHYDKKELDNLKEKPQTNN